MTGTSNTAQASAADLVAQRAAWLADADAERDRRATLASERSDSVLDRPRYEELSNAIRDSESRESELRAHAARFEPLIAEAKAGEYRTDLLRRKAAREADGAAIAAEVLRKAHALALELHAELECIERHLSASNAINRELREHGTTHRRRDDGATVSSREPGFEDVAFPVPAGFVHPSRVLHLFHLPSLTEGPAEIRRAKR